MMTGRHVISGEEATIGVVRTLAVNPVEYGPARHALVHAPGVLPRLMPTGHLVSIDHHVEVAVTQESYLAVERKISRAEERGVVSLAFQRLGQTDTRDRRIHIGDRRILRMRQLGAPDAERRLHRLGPMSVVILESHTV